MSACLMWLICLYLFQVQSAHHLEQDVPFLVKISIMYQKEKKKKKRKKMPFVKLFPRTCTLNNLFLE